MKILFYSEGRDYRYNSFVNILNGLSSQFTVGFCEGNISHEDIRGFGPDIIMHNKQGVDRFPSPVKAISININESNSENSFSLKNKTAKNYLEPYCILSGWNPNLYSDKYASKTVYIGNPSVFQGALKSLISDDEYGFKFLCETPLSVLGYAGACLPNESSLFYKGSKASLLVEGDLYRYRDILMANGNPVSYKGNIPEFLEDVRERISGKKEDGEVRKNVLRNHTDYDRLSGIFSIVGLKKISENIRELKRRKLNENNDMC